MRVFAMGLACLALAGCCMPSTTTGWSFQIGKPPTIQGSALLSPSHTNYTAAGLASGPLSGPLVPLASSRAIMATTQAVEECPPPRMMATQACTLDEVCRRLDAISKHLETIKAPPRLEPLPK